MRHGIFAILLAAALSVPAAAQTVSEGQNEILGFVGVVSKGGGATVGGGIQHGIRNRWILSGELGYLAGNGSPFRGGDGNHGVSIDANAHFLIPLRSAPEFTPYVLGGLGVLIGGSDAAAGLNLGGGARWQIGRDWGLRPELKFLIGDGTTTRFTLGIYKRF
jgi:hypothetical protein